MNIGKFLRTPFHTTSLVAASRLNTYLKLITESVDQGAKSIENFQKRHQERNRKNRKKNHHSKQRNVHSTPEKHLQKGLDMS